MQAPVQVPPVPRYFMQPIVGKEWLPQEALRSEGAPRQDRRGRRKSEPNRCLVQLTTFAAADRRRLWAFF